MGEGVLEVYSVFKKVPGRLPSPVKSHHLENKTQASSKAVLSRTCRCGKYIVCASQILTAQALKSLHQS